MNASDNFANIDVDLAEESAAEESAVVGLTFEEVYEQHERLKTLFNTKNMQAFLKAVKARAIKSHNASKVNWHKAFLASAPPKEIHSFFEGHPALFAIYNEADGQVAAATIRDFVHLMAEDELFPVRRAKGGVSRAVVAADIIAELQKEGADLSAISEEKLEALRGGAVKPRKPRKPRNAKKRRMEDDADEDGDEEMDDADEDAPLDASVQCEGRKRNGDQCGRWVKDPSRRCHNHRV